MSEVTSLVISIISLTGTVLATAIGAYATYYNEERKAKREVHKILLKYRDPLLLSAQDLQARLYGLCDLSVLDFMTRDGPGDTTYRDTLYIYTAYVVGQYLSWAWILRRQAQFMALMSSSAPAWSILPWEKNRTSATVLMQKIDSIKAAFNNDAHPDEHSFILFKAHQTGIGEIMSCQDPNSGEYYCMGFATFTQRWKNGELAKWENVEHAQRELEQQQEMDNEKASGNITGVSKLHDREFRLAFKSIEDGINAMWKRREHSRQQNPNAAFVSNEGSDGRLRRLQHLLLDLIDELDPKGLLNNKDESKRARSVPNCKCSKSPCDDGISSRPVAHTKSNGAVQEATLGAQSDSHEKSAQLA